MNSPECHRTCYFDKQEIAELIKQFSPGNSSPATGITFPSLPVDYSKIWTDHMQTTGQNPALKALEYGLYVEAFEAVTTGQLSLPNIGNPRQLIETLRKWVNKEFVKLHETGMNAHNVHHKAFFAYLHEKAVSRLRAGDFNDHPHYRQAGETIQEWVEARLVNLRLNQGE